MTSSQLSPKAMMSSLKSGQAASKFSFNEIRQYRDQFEMFDLNGDGLISTRELIKVAMKLGYKLDINQIEDIMKSNDLDENGFLSFDEFLGAMPGNTEQISQSQHRSAEVRRKFLEYDKDGSGFVSMEEAHTILKKELAFSPQQTIELVRKYDTNNDNKLSYEEFIHFYTKVKTKIDQMKDMFHKFDTDHSNSISLAEAKIMLRRLDMTDDEVELLVSTHDKNNDGVLQYEEFVAFLLKS